MVLFDTSMAASDRTRRTPGSGRPQVSMIYLWASTAGARDRKAGIVAAAAVRVIAVTSSITATVPTPRLRSGRRRTHFHRWRLAPPRVLPGAGTARHQDFVGCSGHLAETCGWWYGACMPLAGASGSNGIKVYRLRPSLSAASRLWPSAGQKVRKMGAAALGPSRPPNGLGESFQEHPGSPP